MRRPPQRRGSMPLILVFIFLLLTYLLAPSLFQTTARGFAWGMGREAARHVWR